MKKLNRSSRKVVSSAVAPIYRSRRARLWSVVPELLEPRQLMSTYWVTTNSDSGAGSLRAAVNAINSDTADTASNPDVIQFNIAGGGSTTISLTSSLQINNAVIIDGTSQSGIQIDGASDTVDGQGLVFGGNAAGSVVQGLAITSFNNAAVVLNAGGVTVQNDHIGTDPSGLSQNGGNQYGVIVNGAGNTISGNLIFANNQTGVLVQGAGSNTTINNNVIGLDANGQPVFGNLDGIDVWGTASALISNASIYGNTVSGNFGDGISLQYVTGAAIQSNNIGADASGHALPGGGNFGNGILLGAGVDSILIGGAGLGNVIVGSQGSGISVNPGSATSIKIQGNDIGVDITGQTAVGNIGDGINVQSGTVLVGGATAGLGNVVSANVGNGINLVGGSTTVYGNKIGVGADGVTPLGNQNNGVSIGNVNTGVFPNIIIPSSNNVIGGDQSGQGNVIANNGLVAKTNGGRGVDVFAGQYNAIEGNAIYGNVHFGIDLGNDGVTMNGSASNLPGNPNNLQAFPTLTSVFGDGKNLTITGTMTGIAGHQYTLDFYTNATTDASGFGQGQVYAGSLLVTIGSNGTASFSGNLAQPLDGQSMPLKQWTATATDSSGNTSEFGADVTETILLGSTTTVTSSANPSAFGQTVTFSATVSGAGVTPTGTVQFLIDGTAVGTPVALVNGVANYSTGALSVAGHTVTAVYSGDGSYYLSSGTYQQTVIRAASNTSLTASTPSSTLAQTITLTATVGPNINGVFPTGTVTFTNGSTVLGTGTLVNGVATLTVSSLGVGSDALAAQYAGDGNFTPSSGSTTEIVNQAASSTTLSATPTTPTFGQTVTLSATVAPSITGYVPTGSVTFMDGSNSLGTVAIDANGLASLQVSTLAVGGHTITAVYSGDANFTASTSNPITETVNAAPSTISGQVTNDLTGNGFSSDDTPLARWTVNLFLNGATTPLATTLTAADGTYSFSDLAPGSYSVQEVLPAGWTETGGNGGYSVTAVNGNNFSGVNFDNFQNVSVSGTIYRDLTGNGFSADDTPMSGVTVNLFANGGATPVATKTSAGDGTYSFANLGPGSYSVQELVPSGYTQTGGLGGYALAAASGQNASGDNFDNQLTPVPPPPPPPATGAISGYVFCDDNLNGVFDATTQDGVVSPESGEAGATVTLTGTTARGANVSLTATTDVNGHYTFGGLSAGTYTVSLTGYSQDHQAEQGHGSVKISYSTTVNLAAGQTLSGAAEGAATTNNGLDFAEIAPGGLQGFVWDDTNNDGNVDFNEAGIVNVTIQLNGITYTGAKVSLTTVTDNNGEYLFTNLQPGSYTLTEVTPNGFTDGKDSVGSLGGSETYSSNCGSSSGCSTGSSNYNDCYGNYGYNCFTHYSNNCYSNCGSNNCSNCGGSSNYCNGKSNCGWSSGCNSAQNTFSNIQIGGCEDVGVGYNFGEHSQSLGSGSSCHPTDTASLAFWHNSYGQALLCSLNGGPNATALGTWLATMFPNLYGTGAKVNFSKMTNTQIAGFYNANDFNVSGIKLDAAVLSAALSSYVTNSTWAGGNYAVKYGFTVSAQGVGYDTLNVGSNGAAFGVTNNSTVTILQALDATDQLSSGDNGQLYGGNATLRAEAYNLYAAIAQNGLTT